MVEQGGVEQERAQADDNQTDVAGDEPGENGGKYFDLEHYVIRVKCLVLSPIDSLFLFSFLMKGENIISLGMDC